MARELLTLLVPLVPATDALRAKNIYWDTVQTEQHGLMERHLDEVMATNGEVALRFSIGLPDNGLELLIFPADVFHALSHHLTETQCDCDHRDHNGPMVIKGLIKLNTGG